jgi:Flp pilus assembly protein TadD
MFLFNQQQPGEAEGEFQRVVQLQPNNVQGWNGLGVLSMREGKDANAVASFEKCIRIDPEFDRPYLNLAAIYFKSGQRAQALELLSGYLRSHPDNQEIAEAVKQLGAAN